MPDGIVETNPSTGLRTDLGASEAVNERKPMLVLGIRFQVVLLILVMQALLIYWVADRETVCGVYLICCTLMMPAVLYLLLAAAAAVFAVLCMLMMAATGIPAAAAVGVMLVYVACVIAGARIRAEAGGQWTFSPVVATAQRVTYSAIGTRGMTEGALAASGYLHLAHVDIRAQSLPYLMEGMEIAQRSGIDWKAILRWVAIGTVTALAIGWWASLVKFCDVGAAGAKANQYPLVKTNIAFKKVERMLTPSRRHLPLRWRRCAGWDCLCRTRSAARSAPR